MPEYTHPVRSNANPEDLHVEIKNDFSGQYDYVILRKRLDYVGGRGYNQESWQVVGTLKCYNRQELSTLKADGKLRALSPKQIREMRPKFAPVRKVRRRLSGLSPENAAESEYIRELGEETGRNDRLRLQLGGLTDFVMYFEDVNEWRPRKHTLAFFRAAGSFQGSLPYYYSDVRHARQAISQIIALQEFSDMVGRVGSPGGDFLPPFAGSITYRCETESEAVAVGQQFAQIIGHMGNINVCVLGSSVDREIDRNIGVRDTQRRVHLEQMMHRMAS